MLKSRKYVIILMRLLCKIRIDTRHALCYACPMILRKHVLIGIFAAVFSMLVAPAWAQDDMPIAVEESSEADDATVDEEAKASKKKKKGKKTKKNAKAKDDAQDVATSAVAEALGKLKTLKGKPNLKAEYYIYMCSASWCRYCCECMPIAVDEYKKIKRSKRVEFILINGDKSDKIAKDYLKGYKAKFPYIMFDEVRAAQFANLPGSSAAMGFPAAAIVDRDGNVVFRAIGAGQVKELLHDWKKHTAKSLEAPVAE